MFDSSTIARVALRVALRLELGVALCVEL